jgi:hypothetical protein
MFVIGNMMRGFDENKPRMAARITRGEWLTDNTRYFMWRSVSIVRYFVDSRLRNFFPGFEFFGHCGLLVVDEMANNNLD